MKFKIKNKEIQDWIESREWLTHYSGNGTGLYAHFVQIPKDELSSAEKCEDTGYPLRSASYNSVDLDKEGMATYSMPKVHFKICESHLDDILNIEVHFAHLRTGDGFEKVFRGYIKSREDIINVFELLGLNEKHL